MSRMVCFAVEIVLQIPERSNLGSLEKRVSHVIRHCNADFTKQKETHSEIYYTIRVCDNDTITLLRDFPTPFNVISIQLLKTGETLYLYRRHLSPPPIPLYKNIYWLAKSTERWKFIYQSKVESS